MNPFETFLQLHLSQFSGAPGAATSQIATKEYAASGRGVILNNLSRKDMGPSASSSMLLKYVTLDDILRAIDVPGLKDMIERYDPKKEYIIVASLDTGSQHYTLVHVKVFDLRQVGGIDVHINPGEPAPVCYKCAGCRKSIDPNPKFCANCRMAVYCSKECQRSNWPQHKEECMVLNALRRAGKNLFS